MTGSKMILVPTLTEPSGVMLLSRRSKLQVQFDDLSLFHSIDNGRFRAARSVMRHGVEGIVSVGGCHLPADKAVEGSVNVKAGSLAFARKRELSAILCHCERIESRLPKTGFAVSSIIAGDFNAFYMI